MDESRRVWALTLATALVASGIGLGAAFLAGDGGEPESTATPAAETAAPAATPTPAVSPGATTSPGTSPAATPAKTAPPTQDPAAIDCDQTPTFCSSSTGRMTVADGKLSTEGRTDHSTNYANVPTTSMTWRFTKPDGTQASIGADIERVQVEVHIVNRTSNRTFVFPRREVVVQPRRNNANLTPLRTTGASFEMAPGASLDATFEIGVTEDGAYDWRGKSWFYEK